MGGRKCSVYSILLVHVYLTSLGIRILICFVSILAVFKTLQKIIFFWMPLVFVALRRLSLVAVSRSTVHCSAWALLIAGGFSCCRAQALGIFSSCKSQALEHGLSRCGVCVARVVCACSVAGGIFRDQKSNLYPLH